MSLVATVFNSRFAAHDVPRKLSEKATHGWPPEAIPLAVANVIRAMAHHQHNGLWPEHTDCVPAPQRALKSLYSWASSTPSLSRTSRSAMISTAST
jgi:hypothetical protein